MIATHSISPFAKETNGTPEVIYSRHDENTHSKPKKDRTSPEVEVSPLAQASFDAFVPFINIFDPGVRFDDQIVHAITKQDWAFHREWKAYKADNPNAKLIDLGLTHKNGIPFHPYFDVVCNIYSPEHVEAHIFEGDVGYYTSGHDGLCLPYIDLDWHLPWQTDGERAVELLNSVFPCAYNRSSPRGHNWFPKIRYRSVDEANETMDFVEHQLKLLLLSNGILCDIEVKGTITTPKKSGRLAKMPFNCPLQPRDPNDRWDLRQLDKFTNMPIMNCSRLRKIAEGFVIDHERVQKTFDHKQRLKDPEKTETKIFRIIPASKSNVKRSSNTPAPVSPKISKKKNFGRNHVHLEQPGHELTGDAFIRAKNAVMMMRRRHGFELTEDHVLNHMQETGCFSGNWLDNLKNRQFRVRWWMDLSAKTFDPKLCTRKSREQNHRHVTPEYAQKHLSDCLAVAQGIECAQTLRSNSGRTVCTDADKAQFLLLLKFYGECPNEDGTMPGDRFKGDWIRLHRAGVFSRPWQPGRFTAIKNWLSDLGLIEWVDHTFKPGRWEGNRQIKGIATKWKASPKLVSLFSLTVNNNDNLPNPLFIATIAEMARSLTKCHWKDRIRPVQLPWETLTVYQDKDIEEMVGFYEALAA